MCSEENPSKADLVSAFKKLRSIAANKVCFDCGASNPTWSSVTYGVFICIDCSAIHRGLGVHLSFVRSTQLDTNWTWLQLRAMQVGGNSNATQFFRQHGCTTTDSQQKYRSRAANLYREKLHHAAAAAMRLHGTKIHIEHADQQISPPPQKGDVDFFEDLDSLKPLHHVASQPSMSNEAYMLPQEETGPTVEGIDQIHKPTQSQEPIKKSNLGTKKPKKGKLGAHKVSANFNDIEKQAETMDKEREEAAKNAFQIQTKPKEDDSNVNKLSARLMVQDIGKEMAREEERLQKTDPKKGDQVERLGMGFHAKSSGGVSHSLTSNIQTIRQEGVRAKPNAKKDAFEDSWTILNKEPSVKEEDDFFDAVDRDIGRQDSSDNMSSWDNNTSTNEASNDRFGGNDRGSGSGGVSRAALAQGGEDAQKKFGNAKSISSDMYFGGRTDADFETRANLNRFEGASSIGSADLFGGGNNSKPSQYNSHVPDMADVKDSIRQGVSKVAGKMSNLSSSVQGYIGSAKKSWAPA